MKAVLFIALLALACNVAFASHFRYVTMSWSRPSAASGDVKIKIQAAFRSAFFSNGALANGDLVTGVGNVDFGDGKAAVPIALRVTATGSGYGDDWFIGETEVDVKYNLTDTYYVVWGDCCRIDGLEDGNSQANYQFVLTVDPTSSITQSPQVVQFPLMYFYLNRANSIQLPFLPAQPSGEVPTFSIRSDNTGLVTASPSGLSVTPGGVVNWTPSKKGMFAIQFGADGGASSLPLDLILVVVDPPSNSPPTIDAPTVNTISFIPGTVVTFPVIASDPDSGDVVTITTTSLPVGSSLPACTPAQQCSETFSWPTNGASGAAIVCFQASDDKGNVSAQKCVTLIPQTDNPCPSGSTDGVGCVAKKVSNKCVGNGFYTKTESVGGCATLSFDEFGVGC